MKHRKIGQELARNIASAIADKAFEHLLPQAQAVTRNLIAWIVNWLKRPRWALRPSGTTAIVTQRKGFLLTHRLTPEPTCTSPNIWRDTRPLAMSSKGI